MGRSAGGSEQATLEEVWAEVDARLRAFLERRGVPADSRSDVAQEVAVRAVQHRVPFADADDLMRWASTVAWRVYLGQMRRPCSRPTVDISDLNLASSTTAEDVALGRFALADVRKALRGLSARDRQLVLGALDPRRPGDRHDRVPRFRARQRLRSALLERPVDHPRG